MEDQIALANAYATLPRRMPLTELACPFRDFTKPRVFIVALSVVPIIAVVIGIILQQKDTVVAETTDCSPQPLQHRVDAIPPSSSDQPHNYHVHFSRLATPTL
jgi:hypothetical protein